MLWLILGLIPAFYFAIGLVSLPFRRDTGNWLAMVCDSRHGATLRCQIASVAIALAIWPLDALIGVLNWLDDGGD